MAQLRIASSGGGARTKAPLIPDWMRTNSAKAPPATIAAPVQTSVSTYSGAAAAPTGSRTVRRAAAVAPSGPSAADIAAANARSAAAASLRSTVNQNKSMYQQKIDANNAQISANQNQLDALQKLISGGLATNRDAKIQGIEESFARMKDSILASFGKQEADLNKSKSENDASEADQSFANLGNRVRERGELIDQAASQGAGESDLLKAQMQALRNWNSNQSDINRSYFDTLQSVNNNLTDLNTSTKSSLENAEQNKNYGYGGEASIWNDFNQAMSNAYTSMGNADTQNFLLRQENAANGANVAAQQSVLDKLAAGVDPTSITAPAAAQAAAGKYTSDYFSKASDAAAASWKPTADKDVAGFKGAEQAKGNLNNTQAAQAATNRLGQNAPKAPQGATLRKW